MFTGIITDIGKVQAVEEAGDTRFVIETQYDVDDVDIGASIACSGVCLTVVKKGQKGNQHWFAVDASAETLSCTNARDWQPDRQLNLERALKVGDELGGHIVSGHVDGVGVVVALESEGDSLRITFEVPKDLGPFIAQKGSVAIEGVSLTVNEVDDLQFGVNIIPHTQEVTTLGELNVGRKVNLEIDTMARYVARLQEFKA